jgi:GNAT superfamily N-acetyltransferase
VTALAHVEPQRVHAALWALDLARVQRPEACGAYVADEVREVRSLARAMRTTEAEVAGRFARGCRAWVVTRQREVVSWLWVSAGVEYAWPLGRPLFFAADEVHGWDVGTVPEYRGLGLAPRLLRCAGWQLAREGRAVMWNGILDDNEPSQAAHANAGFRPIVRLTLSPAGRLDVRPADYAPPRLVERARRILDPRAAGTPSAATIRR